VGVDFGILIGRDGTAEPRQKTTDRPGTGFPPEGGNVAEAYCVKDKRKVEIQNPQSITMKNGKPAIKGTCPMCGNSVFRIGAG